MFSENIDYAYELMNVLDKIVIPGINVKVGLHEFKYYAGISLEELQQAGIITDNTAIYEFDYHIAAFEEYFGQEGYRVTVYAKGSDLETADNCLFDEVYLPEGFNMHNIVSQLKDQQLQELSAALYKKLQGTPFVNLPQPRIITIPEKDWQIIDKLALESNLSLGEYIRKKALE